MTVPPSQPNVPDAVERLVRLGPRELAWPEVCARAGVDHEVADPLWRALGFADVPADVRAYTEEDVRALRIAAEGIEPLRGEQRERALRAVVSEARLASAHLTHVAEIEVDALAEMQALGLRRRALEDAFQRGLAASDIGWLLIYALRRRLDEALRRRSTQAGSSDPVLAVGFVDLVGFTRTSGAMASDQLGQLMERFESLAFDIVTEREGRLVKLIGDEAMFVCPAPEGAAGAALDLVAACPANDLPPARGGLAVGPLLGRGGDYFGRPVNLASRLVDIAGPGVILGDEALAEALTGTGRFEAEYDGKQSLKGIGGLSVWRIRTATTSSNLGP